MASEHPPRIIPPDEFFFQSTSGSSRRTKSRSARRHSRVVRGRCSHWSRNSHLACCRTPLFRTPGLWGAGCVWLGEIDFMRQTRKTMNQRTLRRPRSKHRPGDRGVKTSLHGTPGSRRTVRRPPGAWCRLRASSSAGSSTSPSTSRPRAAAAIGLLPQPHRAKHLSPTTARPRPKAPHDALTPAPS